MANDVADLLKTFTQGVDPNLDLGALVGGITNPEQLVEWIQVDAEWLPSYRALQPLKKSPPTPGDSAAQRYGKLFHPQLTIKLAGVAKPIVSAPYGAPDPRKSFERVKLWASVGLATTFTLAAIGAASLLPGGRKCKP